jgi:hypothetical protein
MKVAIMQPYIFPYIGYFQLVNAVDTFIIYDNIQYTKKGWINRNRFLQGGKDALFSIALKKDSDFLDVNSREVAPEFNKRKLINQIREAYKKAPYFEQTFLLFEKVIMNEETNLFNYILFSFKEACKVLNINTKVIISSNIDIDHSLKAQEKVIAICKRLNANIYINAIGGQELYRKDEFSKYEIELKFIKTNSIEYKQFNNQFVPWLSIIDVMMFNSLEDISYELNNYELI